MSCSHCLPYSPLQSHLLYCIAWHSNYKVVRLKTKTSFIGYYIPRKKKSLKLTNKILKILFCLLYKRQQCILNKSPFYLAEHCCQNVFPRPSGSAIIKLVFIILTFTSWLQRWKVKKLRSPWSQQNYFCFYFSKKAFSFSVSFFFIYLFSSQFSNS